MLAAYNQRLKQLQGLVGVGQNATNTLVGGGNALAGASANLMNNAGNMTAQGISGAGNAIAGAMGNYANLSMFNKYLNQAQGGGQSGFLNAGINAGQGVPLVGNAFSGLNNARRYF